MAEHPLVPILRRWLLIAIVIGLCFFRPYFALGLVPMLFMPPLFGGSGRVLFWDANHSDSLPDNSFSETLHSNYAAMGVTFDSNASWTGTLSDYSLIYWPFPGSDPSWWAQITGATWTGRLILGGENNSLFSGFIAYINGLTAMTGLTITGANVDGAHSAGTAEADPLTVGVTNIFYLATSIISGGTTLSKTEVSADIWLAHNNPTGQIDFLLAGDVNWMLGGAQNDPFYRNLYNVSL